MSLVYSAVSTPLIVSLQLWRRYHTCSAASIFLAALRERENGRGITDPVVFAARRRAAATARTPREPASVSDGPAPWPQRPRACPRAGAPSARLPHIRLSAISCVLKTADPSTLKPSVAIIKHGLRAHYLAQDEKV